MTTISSTTPVALDVDGGLARLRLNRPEVSNGLNVELLKALHEAILTCHADPSVRVVLLTGEGRNFCAGGDIHTFESKGADLPDYLREATAWLQLASAALIQLRVPVVTAVQGFAAGGGGLGLVCASDIVVAAESAKFTMAYSKIAASPDGSSSYFLPRLIGLRRSLELHYTNRVLSAREAMEWGLVNRVHPDAEFSGAVHALARELAQGPTLAFGRAKLLFHQSTQESLETQMELEAQAIARIKRAVKSRALKAYLN